MANKKKLLKKQREADVVWNWYKQQCRIIFQDVDVNDSSIESLDKLVAEYTCKMMDLYKAECNELLKIISFLVQHGSKGPDQQTIKQLINGFISKMDED